MPEPKPKKSPPLFYFQLPNRRQAGAYVGVQPHLPSQKTVPKPINHKIFSQKCQP